MAKLAVVILCNTETHADHGRLTNALELVKEANQEGGDARIVFDGAGTRWVPYLNSDDGPMGKMFQSVKSAVDGACSFYSAVFEIKAEIQKTDIPVSFRSRNLH